MRSLFRDLEYGVYQVKPLGAKSAVGLLAKMLLVEVLAMFLTLPLEMVLDVNSLVYLAISELLSKGLVIWMLVKFYEEEANPLVLSELIEDAFGSEPDLEVVEEVKQSQKRFSRKVFFGLIIVVIVGFRLMYDNSLAYVLTEHVEVSEELIEAFDELFTWPIYALFSVVILAPLYEEILFRKFLLGGMLKKMDPKKAIAISALVFAIIHWNWLQGINAFILGLILGWIYYKTESIGLCIFAHFINNLYAMTLGIVHETFLMEPVLWANSLLCILGGILIIVSKERIERLMTTITTNN